MKILLKVIKSHPSIQDVYSWGLSECINIQPGGFSSCMCCTITYSNENLMDL